MPLPSPKGKQEHDDFIGSCMSDPVMNKEFKDNKQRYAVCESQWRRAKKKKVEKGCDDEPLWEDTEAEIKKDKCIASDDEVRVISE